MSQIGKTYLALLLSSIHCMSTDSVKKLIFENGEKFEQMTNITPGLSLNIYETILRDVLNLDDKEKSTEVDEQPFLFKTLIPNQSDERAIYKRFYGFEMHNFYNPPIYFPKVAVLVSGGVDSSVALWLLKSRGYNVHGFYLKVNLFGEDSDKDTDVASAKQACDVLGVPFHVIPMHVEYKDNVFEYMIDGYKSGKTPNPDVLCNRNVKFGAFLDLAINKYGFDMIASGHYANVIPHAMKFNNNYESFRALMLPRHLDKDQSYFLSRLSASQLNKIICPLGDFQKKEVRRFALLNNLGTHARPDSMGICFLNNFSHSDYLKSHFGEIPGPVVDYFTKKTLGEHKGLYNYTIGQHAVFDNANADKSILDKTSKKYVVSKDPSTNTLYVTDNYDSKKFNEKLSIRRTFALAHIRWNFYPLLYRAGIRDSDYIKANWEPPITNEDLKIMQRLSIDQGVIHKFWRNFKVRSGGSLTPGLLSLSSYIKTENGITQHGWVCLSKLDKGLATGQYAAIYNGKNICVGSGIIVQST